MVQHLVKSAYLLSCTKLDELVPFKTVNKTYNTIYKMHAKVRHPCLFFQFELVDVDVCEDICRGTHPGFESDELENHFHSEDSGEDHI